MLQADVYPSSLLLQLSFEDSNFPHIPYELDVDYNTIITTRVFSSSKMSSNKKLWLIGRIVWLSY